MIKVAFENSSKVVVKTKEGLDAFFDVQNVVTIVETKDGTEIYLFSGDNPVKIMADLSVEEYVQFTKEEGERQKKFFEEKRAAELGAMQASQEPAGVAE